MLGRGVRERPLQGLRDIVRKAVGKAGQEKIALSATACCGLHHPPEESPLRQATPATVSLRLGHGAVLIPHRGIIHFRTAASLPIGGG